MSPKPVNAPQPLSDAPCLCSDAAFPGFNCEGKLFRARALVLTTEKIWSVLARPFRNRQAAAE